MGAGLVSTYQKPCVNGGVNSSNGWLGCNSAGVPFRSAAVIDLTQAVKGDISGRTRLQTGLGSGTLFERKSAVLQYIMRGALLHMM